MDIPKVTRRILRASAGSVSTGVVGESQYKDISLARVTLIDGPENIIPISGLKSRPFIEGLDE